jgi:alkanesulfonate monooxygenase SsuD/methylene tetrahydromethanopterin reductase-like flavin-dependent oxidoreductase (luciferase family)
VTLCRVSGGRLTFGVGPGSDRFAGGLSATGEECTDRRRGRMLDESLEILTAAWSGDPVHRRGRHYTVDGVSILPGRFSGPACVCGLRVSGNVTPLRRPARRLFPINLEHPDQPAEIGTIITELRGRMTARTRSPSPSQPAPIRRPTPRRVQPGG